MEGKMVLNVYDENDEVVKVSEAQFIDLRFGTIRKIMELIKIDDVNNTGELLKIIYASWGELTKILGKIFPDMEYEDWDNIKLSELVPIVITILRYSFVKMSSIPTDEKNSMAE